MSKPGSFLSRTASRLRSLPPAALTIGSVSLLLVLVVGSVLTYRAYDYIQHDNQFCLECHLMREPFERFARSAHRDLGCKDCHRPNLIERSQMGLAQIVEQPDSIRVHAEVPNEICAECHIEGDPERWRQVANTAGHRVHFESDEPGMEGLLCVECHSSSVHEFTPSEMTCGQGGCHESAGIQLGAMADLTIHCVACHDFTAPVRTAEGRVEVASALRPASDQCLGCHEMRSMLDDFPADEPHGGECGVCHDPHRQTTPQEAAGTCAECHEDAESSSPFHRGLAAATLGDCVACHTAHHFLVDQPGDCLSCHTDIFDDVRAGRVSSAPGGHPGAVLLASLGVSAAAQEPHRDFRHAEHRDVECTACHSMERTHGETLVTGITGCRACHHTQPRAARCETCHEPAERMTRGVQVRRTLDIHVGELDGPARDLPFDHRQHADVTCVTCHVEGVHLGAESVNCSGCHEQHHAPTTSCASCHDQPREDAHDAQVHLGCTDCHEATPSPIRGVPRTREFCLVCHQGLESHRPGQNCEACHALPRPTAGSDGPAPADTRLGAHR